MQETARDHWSRAIGRLLPAWRGVLATHATYSALGLILLLPLAGLGARLALAPVGDTALADYDALRFLLSPVGLGGLALVAVLLGLAILFEQASLMALAMAAFGGHVATTVDGLAFAFRRALPIAEVTLRLAARILVILMPVPLVGGALAWFLLGERDIGHYLTQRPPEFIAVTILVGAAGLAAFSILIRRLLDWALTLPLVVFANVPPALAFRESARLMVGRRWRLLVVLLRWLTMAVLLASLVALGIGLAAGHLLPQKLDRLVELAPAVGLLLALGLLGGLLVTGFAAGAFAQTLLDQYERRRPLTETRVPGRSQDGRDRRRDGLGLAAAVLVGLALAVGAGRALVSGIAPVDRVAVVAQRGAARLAPGNTLFAIRKAVDAGADWIEIDVRMTADGALVLIDDGDFMRLAGIPLDVREATLADVRGIDVGSWYSPVFAAARVPTLDEVLELTRGRARLLIEIKSYGDGAALAPAIVEAVEAAGMADEVAMVSVSGEAIRSLRALRPEWRVGLQSSAAILEGENADFLVVEGRVAIRAVLGRARAAGQAVFAGPADSPLDVSRLASLGVTGIVTFRPAMARATLADRAELGLVERLLLQTVSWIRPRPSRGSE